MGEDDVGATRLGVEKDAGGPLELGGKVDCGKEGTGGTCENELGAKGLLDLKMDVKDTCYE